VTRSAAGWTLAGLLAAFLLVLSVPDQDRVLALYAFLLLVGALVFATLVILLATTPPADERRLASEGPAPATRPDELEALEVAVRGVLDARTLDEALAMRVRSIIAARLAREHGVSLDRDPDGARAVLGGGLLWQLIDPQRTTRRTQLSARELVAVVEALEAL
jgi:hypothetical protein